VHGHFNPWAADGPPPASEGWPEPAAGPPRGPRDENAWFAAPLDDGAPHDPPTVAYEPPAVIRDGPAERGFATERTRMQDDFRIPPGNSPGARLGRGVPVDRLAVDPDTEPRRGGRRLPGPVGLAALVAALLVTFGVGAALLSPSFAGGDGVQEAAGQSGAERAAGPAPAQAREAPALAPTTSPSATAAPTATPAPERSATKPKPKPKPKPKSRTTTLEDQVTALVNTERVKAGCGRVRTNEKLRTAARRHSQDMANQNYFSHDSLDGRSPWDRAKAAGYSQPIGENIAKGQRTPESVMDAWMNSAGHRRNILNCDARAIGVGLAFDGNTPIWTQLFGAV
jgi:uncharacterized protein YkwD